MIQFLAYKTPRAKIVMQSSNNTPKRIENQNKNQELQPIRLYRVNTSHTQRSQSDIGSVFNLLSLDTRPYTEKRDFAFVAILKPFKNF